MSETRSEILLTVEEGLTLRREGRLGRLT